MKNDDVPNDLIDLKEAADIADRSIATIRFWVRTGTVTDHRDKEGGPTARIFVSRAEIEAESDRRREEAEELALETPSIESLKERRVRFLSPSEVSEWTGIPVIRVRRMIRTREIGYVDFGPRSKLVPVEALEEFIQSRTVASKASEQRGRELRACVHCEKPFEVSLFSTGKRADAKYCSNSCQVMTSRKRTKERMKEMAE